MSIENISADANRLYRYLRSEYPKRFQLASGSGVSVDGCLLETWTKDKLGIECPHEAEPWPWFRGLITELQDAGLAVMEDGNTPGVMGYVRAVKQRPARQTAKPPSDRPPPLSKDDVRVLRVLSTKPILWKIDDVSLAMPTATAEDGEMSLPYIGKSIRVLIAAGYAERPKGTRSGVSITDAGREFLQTLPAPTAD